MIKGSYLSENKYNLMTNVQKEAFFEQISLFLEILHSIDINSLEIPKKTFNEEYNALYNEIKRICYPYFNDEAKIKTDELFNKILNDNHFINYKPSIIHGDLSLDHILVNDNGIGIFDFGDVNIFDPAYDYIWASAIDDELLNRLLYNKIEYKYRIEEFYKKRTPYYGIIYSIKMNNDENFQANMNYLYDILGI